MVPTEVVIHNLFVFESDCDVERSEGVGGFPRKKNKSGGGWRVIAETFEY